MRSLFLFLFLSCWLLAGSRGNAQSLSDWKALEEFESETVEVLEVGGRLVSGRLADVTETFVLVGRKSLHDQVMRFKVHRVTLIKPSTRKRNTIIGTVLGGIGMGALAAYYIQAEHYTVPWHGFFGALAVGAGGGAGIGYLTGKPERRIVVYEQDHVK